MDGFTNLYFDPLKLKAARERKGLSQAEVARRVGVLKQAIWNYEQPDYRGAPRADVMLRLCALYDVDARELASEQPVAA